MIYFVRDSASGLVKIGYSRSPWLRLSHLQIGSPSRLTMVAIVEGDKSGEAALHKQFVAHWVRGEWFRADGAFAEFLARQPVPLAPAPRRALPAEDRFFARMIVRRGAAKFAGDLGVKLRTVLAWRDRNHIPAGYWLAVHRAGLATLEELASAAEANPRKYGKSLAA